MDVVTGGCCIPRTRCTFAHTDGPRCRFTHPALLVNPTTAGLPVGYPPHVDVVTHVVPTPRSFPLRLRLPRGCPVVVDSRFPVRFPFGWVTRIDVGFDCRFYGSHTHRSPRDLRCCYVLVDWCGYVVVPCLTLIWYVSPCSRFDLRCYSGLNGSLIPVTRWVRCCCWCCYCAFICCWLR